MGSFWGICIIFVLVQTLISAKSNKLVVTKVWLPCNSSIVCKKMFVLRELCFSSKPSWAYIQVLSNLCLIQFTRAQYQLRSHCLKLILSEKVQSPAWLAKLNYVLPSNYFCSFRWMFLVEAGINTLDNSEVRKVLGSTSNCSYNSSSCGSVSNEWNNGNIEDVQRYCCTYSCIFGSPQI